MGHSWPWAIAGRLLLLAFGTFLALVVLAGVLRIGATLMATSPGGSPRGGGLRRILCLGDSNTYGLYVEKSQSYPKALEAQWNSSTGARSVEVLDMGFPVTSSSKLLREFDR